MKKAILPLAIAAALPMSALAAGPIDGKVYGKVNITAVNEDHDDAGSSSEDSWDLNSNASRIGFKGKTELSEGLYAIYKAEFEIQVDDGDKDGETFSQRNIYGGLTGNFGTIFAGKHDTVLKLAQKKVDLFNDLDGGDVKNWMSGETRASNVINYTTPKMGGFSASLMTVLGEDSDSDNDQDGLLDSYSAGVSYSANGLYLGLARDENVDSGSQEKDFLDITRIVATYKFDALTLGAMIQSAEEGDNYSDNVTDATDDSYDEDSYVVSAAYKAGKFTWKLQYGEGEYEEENAAGAKTSESEEEWLQLGVDYKLGKKTKVYAYYSNGEEDDKLANTTDEVTRFGLGMEHKF
ncbi:porin [Maricurvus nonylphenolicus]|uniref:porin n=1 Tax=Maricurvus nonylphenolicus TaxID=1008307 RepID=UPI0036F2924C